MFRYNRIRISMTSSHWWPINVSDHQDHGRQMTWWLNIWLKGAYSDTLFSLMWSQTVDNTKEFTDLLPKTWLLAIKVHSGLKYGLGTGRLIFSVGRRRGSLGMGRVANLGNCCGFRWCLLQRLRLLWHLTDFAHHLISEASIALLLLRQDCWIIFLVKYSDHACLKVHPWHSLHGMTEFSIDYLQDW